jgi:hypothetical protein
MLWKNLVKLIQTQIQYSRCDTVSPYLGACNAANVVITNCYSRKDNFRMAFSHPCFVLWPVGLLEKPKGSFSHPPPVTVRKDKAQRFDSKLIILSLVNRAKYRLCCSRGVVPVLKHRVLDIGRSGSITEHIRNLARWRWVQFGRDLMIPNISTVRLETALTDSHVSTPKVCGSVVFIIMLHSAHCLGNI